ncbi:unnamed protein product [Clonostachys rosea]|uniref:Uncharacterized protein n=1 Tax=Bionectria ochroleuca TaxID=29856 RepID=A0ABY6UPY7_BIOOC|nr:unnamed protein product [Clonostachys rosea]
MSHQGQETELPLLNYEAPQDQQEPRSLARSGRSPNRTAQNFANSDMNHSRTAPWSVDRDQESSVLDGYATETSTSAQNVAIPNMRTNDASGEMRSKRLRPKETQIHTEGERSQTWHPFWLRPLVLGTFSVFFMCYAVVLPVLLALSNRNDGLLEARRDLEQLWRFGPTAVFTLVTVFWSRVELQTLRYFPWVKSQHSHDYYALDYTSKISPVILVQSLRNKHFMVFIITLTTILLKVQIILMPNLFYLKTVWVSKPIDIQIGDSFQTGDKAGFNYIADGYYNARAIQDFNTGIPFGVGNNSLYQTFTDATTKDNDTRGTTYSPITARVDGLFFDVECRQLESCTTTPYKEPFANMAPSNMTWVRLDLKFEDCPQPLQVNVSVSVSNITGKLWPEYNVWTTFGASNNCSALPNQFPQFVYLGAKWTPSPENSSVPIQDACAAILCSPTAWVSKVDIADDGNYPSMTIPPDQTKDPIKVNPYKLLWDSIPSALGGGSIRFAVPDSWISGSFRAGANGGVEGDLRANTFLSESLDLREKYKNGTPHSIYDSQLLHGSVLNLTKTLGSVVAHHQLRNKEEIRTTGSRPFETARLQLNQPVCICLAVLSALLAFICLWAMLRYRGIFENWDRDPATILGLMSIFHSRRLDFLPSFLQKRGARSKLWRQSLDSPLPLPTWLRLVFTVYVLGLIISLIVILKTSTKSNGVVTLREGTPSLWWTVAPTMAFFLVTLYTTSSDTAVRDLATYSTLSTRPCTARELDTSLLDMLGLRALYYSLRWKIYAVTLLQILAMACAFLVSFSSLLFTSKNISGNSVISFKQQSWFGSRSQIQGTKEGKLNATMVSRYAVGGLFAAERTTNFTWPEFTYRDLIFPRLEVDVPNQDWNSNVTFELEAPAVKLTSECTPVSKDVVTFKPFYKVPGMTLMAGDVIYPCPNGTTFNVSSDPSALYYDHDYMIGEFPVPPTLCPTDRWMIKTFYWGKGGEKPNFDYLSLWQCNYTWSEIPTKLHMRWTANGLQIDHQNPPKPDYSKARPLYPPLPAPIFPHWDQSIWPDTNIYDPSYRLYMGIGSRFRHLFDLGGGPLNQTDLGDPAMDQTILENIQSSYGLAAGQLANSLNRLGLDEKSSTEPELPGELPLLSGTVIDNRRLRLVQSPQMTYFVLSILSLALFINAWALISTLLRRCANYTGKWSLDLEMRDLAPPAFNSIAMSDALLYPSNYQKYMSSLEKGRTGLADLRFRMGWFMRKGAQERELTIGVMDDPEFQFLGEKQSTR